MNIYKLIVSAIALSVIGSGVYYYNAYQKAKKDLELTKAKYLAAEDTLREIRNDDTQLVAKLSFPSSDSLQAYVRGNFSANDLFGKVKGSPIGATEFTWQADELSLENVTTPDSSSENHSLFQVRYDNDQYDVKGNFVVDGFDSGERTMNYTFEVTPKPQLFRIITTQSSFNQEVFIESSGQVLSLQSFYTPDTNQSPSDYFYAEGGVTTVGANANGYAALGYSLNLWGLRTYSSFGMGYNKDGIEPVASIRAVYPF